MLTQFHRFIPVLAVLMAFFLIDGGIVVESADARSKRGGKMFSRPAPRKAPAQKTAQQTTTQKKSGGFSKGLMGGLLGGAIGAMLFGSLFGAGGEGMGLLPILLLAGVAFFLFRRFASRQKTASPTGYGGQFTRNTDMFRDQGSEGYQPFGNTQTTQEDGIQQLQRMDPHFDQAYFLEVASDVFFQIQAGWMRRDLDSYRHLLGSQLAGEYEEHFAEMKENGHINKLESIAIRKVELSDCGSDGTEDFVTVLFTANLLDYTVDENTGDLIEGSMTTPVKFAEEWSWARPTGTQDWKLEGIKVIEE